MGYLLIPIAGAAIIVGLAGFILVPFGIAFLGKLLTGRKSGGRAAIAGVGRRENGYRCWAQNGISDSDADAVYRSHPVVIMSEADPLPSFLQF